MDYEAYIQMAKRLITTIKYFGIVWIGFTIGKIIAERFGINIPSWITDIGFVDLLWIFVGVFLLIFLFGKIRFHIPYIDIGDVIMGSIIFGGLIIVFALLGGLLYSEIKNDPIKEAKKEEQRQKNMEICVEAGGIPDFYNGRFSDCQKK